MASTYYILKAGIAPPDLANYGGAVKLMFWRWIVDLGLKVKDRELSQGRNAKGNPLPPVAPKTRKRRKSAMTPNGKGDPSAPYLMPGRGLSRVRSLLTGKAHETYAEFWWKYDAHAGDSWGVILAAHAKRGEAYNVIGLSPRGVAVVAAEAAKRWAQWKGGAFHAPASVTEKAQPVRMRPVGRTNLEHLTPGAGFDRDEIQKAIDEGRSSGFMTADEWARHWRHKASVPRLADETVTSASVRRGSSNVLLQHVWGDYEPISKVVSMRSPKLERAVGTLVETLTTMPGLTPEQLIAVVGDSRLFGEAVTEAIKRRLIAIRSEDGRLVLRVVG